MLRKLLIFCVAACLLGATRVWADAPATRPTIAVVPFDVLGPAGHEWLGRAVQEGIATGLQRSTGFSGVIVAGLSPADGQGAIDMSKSASADAVVFGAVQIQDDQMRVTGQMISTHSGQSLGALVADGGERDLFNIEDRLTERCRGILLASSASKAARPSGPVPMYALVGPTITPVSSRYFDGNLVSQITPPAQLQDEYDRYYFQSADTSGFGCVFTTPGFAWGCGGIPFCGGGGFRGGAAGGPHMVYPVAMPISGW